MNLKVKVTTRTSGLWLTALAAVVGGGAMVAIRATNTEADTAVTPLLLIAAIMHLSFLVLGSMRWVSSSSVPVLAAIVVEAGFSDDPSWIRSIVLGCWWFVTMELSWEAIDRRHGAHYTTAATIRRVQDVVSVVALSLMVGLVASVATALAPVRSVAVQALVLAGLLAGFVTLVRHVAGDQPTPEHETS